MANQSKKVTLVGSFGVGKTSLFHRYIDDSFSENYLSTLGVQIKKKTVSLPNGTQVSLILWDTEGVDTLLHGRSSYLLGSHAFVYVFDLTRIETYKEINTQIDFLRKNHPNITIKIVGNKLDAVNEEKAIESLTTHNVKFDYLTSAKSGTKVEDLFNEIAANVIDS